MTTPPMQPSADTSGEITTPIGDGGATAFGFFPGPFGILTVAILCSRPDCPLETVRSRIQQSVLGFALSLFMIVVLAGALLGD